MSKSLFSSLASALCLYASTAAAEEVSFKDPVKDDNGPGSYKYPTDAVYKPGSFDITELTVKSTGGKVDFEVGVNADLEDAWKTGAGFSTQMVFVFIDMDNKPGSGYTTGMPGLNVEFAPADAWDKVVVLSPQAAGRLKTEAKKAGPAAAAVVVPTSTKASGRKIKGTVDLKDLGGGNPALWGYQIVMQSNEGFPAATDFLTRKVNEYEGQHRFGGGHDGECDPHAIDILAGQGKGDASEVAAQQAQLKYECDESGAATKKAQLTMVRKPAPPPAPAGAPKPTK